MIDPVKQIEDLIEAHHGREATLRERLAQLAKDRRAIELEIDGLKKNDPIPGLKAALHALKGIITTPVPATPPESKVEPRRGSVLRESAPIPAAESEVAVVEKPKAEPAAPSTGYARLIHYVVKKYRFKDPQAAEMVLLLIEERDTITIPEIVQDLGLAYHRVHSIIDAIARERNPIIRWGEKVPHAAGTGRKGQRPFLIHWNRPDGETPTNVHEGDHHIEIPEPEPPKKKGSTEPIKVPRGEPILGTGKQSVTRAEYRKIFTKLRNNKYSVIKGGKHYKVIDVKGKTKMTIPGTPGDHRALANTKADIKRVLGLEV